MAQTVRYTTASGSVYEIKGLSLAELDGVERDLNRAGTPPDNILRRMIAEIRRSRANAAKTKRATKARKKKEAVPL